MGLNEILDYLKAKIEGKELWISDFANKRVLDVGCGDGSRILKYGESWEGIDVNKAVLKIARSKGAKVKFGSATKLPYKDGTFDMVLSHHVIEHLTPKEAHQHLKEAARVLRKGGVMIIASPMNTERIWNTFTHIRPYPPAAIKKQTTYITGETYDRIPLRVGEVFYFSTNPIFMLLANLGIQQFRLNYIMKLYKVSE